jgi:DNA-binding transcriptional MerR regulator
MSKVTVKALRFYEEEGLLEPAHTDAINGYRYYSSDQLPRVFRIVSLRQCGFSIPDIRAILAGRDVARLFSERKRDLENQAIETSQQLASINHYIESIGKDNAMKYQIVMKELPCVLVYSKRMIAPSYDAYFDIIPNIGQITTAINPELRCVDDPPYCFIMYHDGEYKDHDIDIEFCEAVTDRGNGKLPDGITFKTIDRVPQAACVLHKGPYRLFPEAYAAVIKWVEDNGYVPAGALRESYIDGIWNCESEEDWLTEIQVPILSSASTGDTSR